jgi:hypothetical protein
MPASAIVSVAASRHDVRDVELADSAGAPDREGFAPRPVASPGPLLYPVLQPSELRLQEVWLETGPVRAAFQLLQVADAGEHESARKLAVREGGFRVYPTGPSQHRHALGSCDGRPPADRIASTQAGRREVRDPAASRMRWQVSVQSLAAARGLERGLGP